MSLYQHDDAPAEAYHSEWQQPPFAPIPQEEGQKIERNDEPTEVYAAIASTKDNNFFIF